MQELSREEWLVHLPFRWTQTLLDELAEKVVKAQQGNTVGMEDVRNVKRALEQMLVTVEPYFAPLIPLVQGVQEVVHDVVEPRVAATIQVDLLLNTFYIL